ncbi:histidine kinase [Sphingomonas sp. Leaf357]|uniref:hybrid sensor histidine kinase/response regulator n=1 Tax=Sphingomonas sp. Leaf357 TaxID=1736350 RepID=UPI0006FF7EA7|nr:response regulator [Sphingomonas sp. Leaf357]KQS04819.1 histidine kinase [Sphingomonas sp. Leaf357]
MASLPVSTDPHPSRTAALIAGGCGVAAAALVLWLIGNIAIAGAFLATGLILAGGVVATRRLFPETRGKVAEPDWSVARALAAASPDAVAITDRAGRLICANDRYEELFAGFPTPPGLPVDDNGVDRLSVAGRAAWRDGSARVDRILARGTPLAAMVERAGQADDLLVWRFRGAEGLDMAASVEGLISGPTGDRLAAAGIMTALIGPEGRIRSANRVFRARAMGQDDSAVSGRDFARFLITDDHGQVRFEREGLSGVPLRVLQIPFLEGDDAPLLVALLDEETNIATPAIGGNATAHVRSLVSLMPFGMALVDRDGRFIQMNDAFARAAQVDSHSPPLYPGDLLVREDKGVVADAIRRFANGATHSTDLAVRLKDHPDEPVALSIAGARGLGEAAVLLSLKDNGEETRLKREVAQATKMQAVGQLAGGVAHDFNNILTAIIGHCDLMLMRHTPGDSDYDDIQQIRANSNRAASLTRQLLAFSRQQTLRPQVLQLPDVISEVSNLLKRLLGETVTLTVKHGRSLGAVRADPGQLEQVVVNLAVNARDAMMSKGGGGVLSIQTRQISSAQVRHMGNDILPIADYVALEIADTGTGIPAEILPKIFEPFFTTKEVGKGTGLGLSTVYGIVKQSGGYIFADNNKSGPGTTFTIYLPVHTATAAPEPARAPVVAKERPTDLWGTGTILLVEDEDMVRAIAERALSRQGYTVLTAEHGEAALEVLAKNDRPDLLISDVMMPIMDGPTMVRQARERYPDLPILFMSGYAEETLRKSIDLDNVQFLAKPFSVQQLAEAARAVLVAK